MARRLRLEFAGTLYHLTSRGDGREMIFLSDGVRRVFVDVVAAVWERFNWVVHAYRLMTNHYHLLVETPDANLSKGMLQLNGVYTQRFNHIYNRTGHVFQGDYKAILVRKDAYLPEVARYLVLNPVRVRMVRAASDWPWCSYRAVIGEAQPPEWLETRAILRAFGETESKAIDRYARFVAEGKGQLSPWEHPKNQVFLGSDTFVPSMRRQVPRAAIFEKYLRRSDAQPPRRYLSTLASIPNAAIPSSPHIEAADIRYGTSAVFSAYTTPVSARSSMRRTWRCVRKKGRRDPVRFCFSSLFLFALIVTRF